MLHRQTCFTGDLDIAISGRDLTADVAGETFHITAPDEIHTESDHAVLGWLMLAAWPCAFKNIERYMPEEVARAALKVSQWVLDGCPGVQK